MTPPIYVDAVDDERWAVFFLPANGETLPLGTAVKLAGALELAAAWWTLRDETKGETHGAVVVSSVKDSQSDPFLWHARLDANGWAGASVGPRHEDTDSSRRLVDEDPGP